MRVDTHQPVGATVTDIDLRSVDAATTALLQDELATHGVLVMPEQTIDDAEFLRFLKGFGELMFTVGETPLPGFPDLNVISNVGRETPPTSTFHVDTSYVAKPPAYTALRAVDIPEVGGETLFTNQYTAYDTLPEEVRERLAGRLVTHVVTGLELGPDEETSAEHPVFQRHPRTGRTALFLSTPKRCVAISGLDDDEAAETVRQLFDHSTQESNVLRHRWSPGDVVMWDNRCVLHKADHSGVVGDRVMHRGMVAAE